MGRVCPTFVAGRWVGAEFFEENPSFGGSGEQVGHRGFGSPGKLKVRITVFPIPEHGLFFLSQSAIVSELFRLVVCSGLPLWGNGKAALGVCPQLASPCASYRARASPGVCLLSRGGSRQRVGPREACPSGQVDRAPRGCGGEVSELVASPRSSIRFGLRGGVAPHPPLTAKVFRTLVVGRSLRG